MSKFKGIVFGAVIAASMFVAGSASAATYCQQNGHGAKGCSLADGTTGWCVSNTNSSTGYVCKDKDPNAPAESIKGTKTSGSVTPAPAPVVKESKATK